MKPIVAIDIDGTLGNYHQWFTQFAEMWTGKKMPSPGQYINPGQPFYKTLGISKTRYRECKLAYRQGGLKRGMPCYPNARMLTVETRKLGAEVWICTSRPFNQLGNIDGDTRHWLRRHGIQYDNILWGEHKYRDLVRQVGADNVVCVLDDLPEMCAQANSLGLMAILRDQPYNRAGPNGERHSRPRAWNLSEAYGYVNILVKDWKEDHSG